MPRNRGGNGCHPAKSPTPSPRSRGPTRSGVRMRPGSTVAPLRVDSSPASCSEKASRPLRSPTRAGACPCGCPLAPQGQKRGSGGGSFPWGGWRKREAFVACGKPAAQGAYKGCVQTKRPWRARSSFHPRWRDGHHDIFEWRFVLLDKLWRLFQSYLVTIARLPELSGSDTIRMFGPYCFRRGQTAHGCLR